MPRSRTTRRRGRRLRAALGVAIAAPAFAMATAPAVADPLGAQVQVSAQGPADASADATEAALAYNPTADQYLAVWEGDTATAGEDEVFGRLLDGGGDPLGGVFRISTMGPDGAVANDAADPAVVFNPDSGEYLVVWSGTDVAGEPEIYGQRISASGVEVGADDVRISDMGTDGVPGFGTTHPDVAHDPGANEYLVTWAGDDDTGALVQEELEIYVQRLDASGAELGVNDRRISDVGGTGDAARDADEPAIAHNPIDGQFLVVWDADETDGESEIYGQRLRTGGVPLGTNDFRISTMGPDGDTTRDAEDPAVAHLTPANEYLVVWEGDEADDEDEIHGQRLSSAGAATGADDFRISDMGPDGNISFDAQNPELTANARAAEYMVAWEGTDDALPAGKDEVFGQRLTSAGAESGTNDFRISVTETATAATVGAARPNRVVYNSRRNEYLTGWEADGDVAPRLAGKYEIYVRRSSAGAVTAPPPPICATAPAPPAPSAPGTVTLTVAQLQINQRIYAAAIKRAEAINAWLDAGVEARDLCAGGLLASSFHAGIATAAGANGALDPAAAPDPRPITPEPLATKTGVTFTLSTEQLRINQRIAARGVREANALQERLAAGLSGGDIDDGAVTGGKISTSVVITGATPAATPPARTRTVVKPPAPKTGVVFTLSAAQLAIDQRIGQAAIRRLNVSRDALLTGIAADELKTATVTAVDLAPGVAP